MKKSIRPFQWGLSLIAVCSLLACAGGEDDPEESGDGDGDGDEAVNTEFCATYCEQGLQDVADSGCEAEMPPTQEGIDECIEGCEIQIAFPECGELSEVFWQCTLDEYPGTFECGDDGRAMQPTSCDDEQQAVLDCFNSD